MSFWAEQSVSLMEGEWSFLQRFYLDNVFFLREKNLSSFLLDVDGFSRVFLLKIFDFRSEPGEFLVFVLSTVSLAHRGRKWSFSPEMCQTDCAKHKNLKNSTGEL